MLRSLFCAAAIFVLVLSVCLLPQSASARRCPVDEPETLLSLYQNSDAIYIASFDKSTDGEVIETTADYTSLKIVKFHYFVTEGERRNSLSGADLPVHYCRNSGARPNAESESRRKRRDLDSETTTEAGYRCFS